MLRTGKVWYALTSAANVCLFPFLNVYLADTLGFSSEQIGLLSALRPWLSAPSASLLCTFADRFRAHRSLLIVAFVVSTMLRLGLLAVPPCFGLVCLVVLLSDCIGAPVSVLADATVVAVCDPPSQYGKVRLWASIGYGALSPVAGLLIQHFGISAGFAAYGLLALPALFVALRLGRHAARAAAGGVAKETNLFAGVDGMEHGNSSCGDKQRRKFAAAAGDDLAAPLLSEEQQCNEGGWPAQQQREVAGLIGAWYDEGAQQQQQQHLQQQPQHHQQGQSLHTAQPSNEPAAHAGSKQLARHGALPAAAETSSSLHTDKSAVKAAFHGSSGVATSLAGAGDAVLLLTDPHAATGPVSASEGPESGLGQLLCDARVLVFLGQAVVVGYGLGTIGAFNFLHVESLGGTKLLMSLMLMVSCIAELPFFYWQAWLMERLPVALIFHSVMLFLALRCTCYGMLPWAPSVWMVLPVELLNGATFALAWGAGVVHCSQLVAPQHNATMQSLFSFMFGGLGAGLGGIAGGIIMQRLGSQALFFITALVVLCGWALAVIADCTLGCRAARASRRAQMAPAPC